MFSLEKGLDLLLEGLRQTASFVFPAMRSCPIPPVLNSIPGTEAAPLMSSALPVLKEEANVIDEHDAAVGAVSGGAKRTRDSNPDIETGVAETRKRSRGRPRVDTRDETAAERRRTQIRLAQRAYRSRKDSAITTLEKKVKGLEEVQQDTAKQLQDLVDALTGGKITPEQTSTLKGLIRGLSAPTGDQDSETVVSDNAQGGTSSPSPDHSPITSHPKNAQSEHLECLADTAPQISQFELALPGPRSHLSSDTQDLSTQMPGSSSATSLTQPHPFGRNPVEVITYPTHENASFPMNHFLGSPLNSGYSDAITNPSPYLSLGIQDTLSHLESTFGRRFQRSAQEAGYRLITSPNPHLGRYGQVFGFCLQYESAGQIRSRLSTIIRRSAKDSLDFWEAPFVHLGGSGTVYSNNQNFLTAPLSASGNDFAMPIGNQATTPLRKPLYETGCSMGPFTPQIEALREEKLDTTSMHIKESGFEGQFYDPDEVERYLRDRGIFIGPGQDVVEVEIDLGEFCYGPTSSSPTGSTQRYHPASTPTDLISPSCPSNALYLTNSWQAGFAYPPNTQHMSPLFPGTTGFNGGMQSSSMDPVNPARIKVRIDVWRLVAGKWALPIPFFVFSER